MKATFFTLLALVAAPALAGTTKAVWIGSPAGEITAGTTAVGSLAARALAGSKLGARATDAEFFCQLPTRAVSGAPANAANIDGIQASPPSLRNLTDPFP